MAESLRKISMNRFKYIVLIALLTSFSGISVGAIEKNSYIEAIRWYYKEAFQDIKPARAVSSWMVPFDTRNRHDIPVL
jgi:DNA-binding transcriptional regulator LsrR (DeoR family)